MSVLFGGWAGNSVALAFINNTVVFSNLGIGGSPEAGTKIYTVNNQAGINAIMIGETLISGLGNATSPVEILALLGKVDPKPLYIFKTSFKSN